jgi:nucleoside phosphorylase
VIPSSVANASGNSIECDPWLSSRLIRAARELGFEPSTVPLITLPVMATGSARQLWRSRGFGAVDMESAHLADAGTRLAAVRVILDSPEHELSDEWIRPLTMVLRPARWGEALGLAFRAPQYALRAARVAARGLSLSA